MTAQAFAFRSRVHFESGLYSDDMVIRWPERLRVPQALILAHELTHVWQWQNRDATGYHPLKASLEHIEKDDPYLLEIDPEKPFLDYAYEQQGVLVEEFVCCRALDPDGARTDALARLVGEVFPSAARRETVAQSAIRLPWDGVETAGICS